MLRIALISAAAGIATLALIPGPASADTLQPRCYGAFGSTQWFYPWCDATPSLGGGGGAKPDLTAYRGPDVEVDCPEPEYEPNPYPNESRRSLFSTIPRDPYACSTCYRSTIIIHHPDGSIGTNVVKGKGLIVVRDVKSYGSEKGSMRALKTGSNGNGNASSAGGGASKK